MFVCKTILIVYWQFGQPLVILQSTTFGYFSSWSGEAGINPSSPNSDEQEIYLCIDNYLVKHSRDENKKGDII